MINKNLVIISDWLTDYITKEVYTFCIKLQELYKWDLELSSNINNINFLKYKNILFVTYDELDINKYKTIDNNIYYKVDDLFPMTDIKKRNLINASTIISPYQYLLNRDKYSFIDFDKTIQIFYSSVSEFYENIEFNKTPENKILLSGAINDTYPFRKYVSLLNDPYIRTYWL